MAEVKKDVAPTPAATDAPDVNAIKGDVQEKFDQEQEQGFLGVKVDPRPNSDYSLESGPDAPPNVPNDRTAVTQPHAQTANSKEKS